MQTLTQKEKKFADSYAQGDNQTQAALKAGYSPKTAHLSGHVNIRKYKIQQYLDKIGKQAVENVWNMANEAKNESVKLKANEDIVNWLGIGKEPLTPENGNDKTAAKALLQAIKNSDTVELQRLIFNSKE